MKLEQNIDLIGDNHISTSSDTPMKEDAFELSNDKINRIHSTLNTSWKHLD